jgi:4-hydroxyphenylpyruvate dioxygenase
MTAQYLTIPPANSNPLNMHGIEFVEYATAQPEQFGTVLEKIGFGRVARHRSRNVFLYRQGEMNIVVNADPEGLAGTASKPEEVILSAVAFRVADANLAYKKLINLGAWPIPTRAGAMELNIPGIHGVADSILYLVDRHREFDIYDVDFIFDDKAAQAAPALAGMYFFGIVQYVGVDRMEEWIDFYDQLFGFTVLPYGESFGVLPNGTLLRSPCEQFYLQLVGPPEDAIYDYAWEESFARLGLGTSDVQIAVQTLKNRGVDFQEGGSVQATELGALTQFLTGGVRFELVLSPQAKS